MPAPTITFEDAILRLTKFWRDNGCLLTQPMNTEVGAGTMNPNTFLRVLGSEPWSVAYVEPSVRPDDSRYGDNPNRIQTHTQFQVILKPDPGDPQERYLRSLQALGIDTEAHDIRFVEDNWESPALGAWGLGWEVWLDGLEITQFTYFQQAGGFALDPVSVEITYGLERILMALQGVRSFKEIAYSDHCSYGDLIGPAEFEMSTYYLDTASVKRVREMAQLYEAEAEEMLAQRLVLPAYMYVLKLSHAFNVLDARGGIGVTERAAFFARMRNLSRLCAQHWLEKDGEPADEESAKEKMAQERRAPSLAAAQNGEGSAPFVFEIGTEELPPADLDSLLEQAREQFDTILAQTQLEYGEVSVAGTPRRLVMRVEGLQRTQPTAQRLQRGPRANIAWEADGTPTKAAIGFAKRNEISVDALRRESVDGDEFAVAKVREGGRSSLEVLAEAMPKLLQGLRVKRGMRWNEAGVAFSRPIRWLLAMHGDQVVPVRFGGLEAGSSTRLLRSANHSENETVPSASDYAETIANAGIIVDGVQRREAIASELERLATDLDAQPDPDSTARLLDEVVNLVESPRVLVGEFEERYLSLPQEVLITVMVKHQRYLPLTRNGGLVPNFVFVANGKRDDELVRRGNEAVLRARYADAEFFYKQDISQPLESYHHKLDRMTFHERLGSMSDKVERVKALSGALAPRVGLSPAEQETLQRAAQLAKDDLGTTLVTEFSALAGVMGSLYARQGGEPTAVADAIADHVKPVSAGAPLPETRAGAVLAVADRLDTLIALMAAGVVPSGTADPFALRRAANGLIEIVTAHELSLDLLDAIAAHKANLPTELEIPTEAIVDWIWRRLEVILREEDGIRADVARASLRSTGTDVATKRMVARDLAQKVDTAELQGLSESLQRTAALAQRLESEPRVDPSRFSEAAEKSLWEAVTASQKEASQATSVDQLFAALKPVIDPVQAFFDQVFVMDENAEVANNRLSLLAHTAALGKNLIDFSELERASAGAD